MITNNLQNGMISKNKIYHFASKIKFSNKQSQQTVSIKAHISFKKKNFADKKVLVKIIVHSSTFILI